MEREILFRGQTRRKGERIINVRGDKCDSNWVYGGIFPQNNGGDFAIIYQQTPEIKKYTVYADTVGQYTGVTDKNGTKIFEGDIVRYGDTIHEVAFEQRNGTAYFGLVYSENETLPFGHYQDLRQIEVIGNIHDNPELLKKE
jgi:uncharacterized phage protein (TIGR01671 family)|uniref:YopX protein n=1 Tax=Siphoviridae sp. ctcuE16 TaxID=2826397 RepID=A0A8S5QX72_9CAUD|nr:MAG TPA: YopX protein [Siphoviridae sp. ctcuE16]